ncbi:hypothetical protein, partial [Bosea vaviloviae]
MAEANGERFILGVRELNGALGDLGTLLPLMLGTIAVVGLACQTARNVAPRSASNIDPLMSCGGQEAARRSWFGLHSRAGSGS